MALQHPYLDHTEAYHTVNMMVASHQAGIQILVVTHASKAAYDEGAGEAATRQFDLPYAAVTSPDPISYAYTRLLDLPEFTGAVAVE